jgi:hypothetical protein
MLVINNKNILTKTMQMNSKYKMMPVMKRVSSRKMLFYRYKLTTINKSKTKIKWE